MTGEWSGTHGSKQILDADYFYQIQYNGSWWQLAGVQVESAMHAGDSGGPDYWNGKAMGLTSAISAQDGFTVYTYVDLDANASGVTICTTDLC